MKFLFLLLISLPLTSYAQRDSVALVNQILAFQKKLNAEYRDKTTSPLKPADLKKFKRHTFFPINLDYAVDAHLTLTPNSPFVPMKATGSLVQEYRTYAIAHFQLHGKSYSLPVYQSKSLMNKPEYTDYLFVPFTDLTTGNETYGGGRYLELRIPKEGLEVIINFNLAYNPYCAYNEKYSCPLVPGENDLPVAILAGVKLDQQ